MAKEDLIPQKMVRVTNPTHAALMRVAAAIQAKTGGYTSMDAAIQVLIEGWGELERISKGNVTIFTSEEIVDCGDVFSEFNDKYFESKVWGANKTKPVSLRAYNADAKANDPNLEPENETE